MGYIISMIAAYGRNRVIGKDNDMPWDHIPKDMKRFKEVTSGKPVIMGRKTHISIGMVLPGRENIVMTRQDMSIDGCTVAHSVKEAINSTGDAEEIMIIGGQEIYELFLPYADKLYLTEIDESFEGDTFFPEIEEDDWRCIDYKKHTPDEKNPYSFSFIDYIRK